MLTLLRDVEAPAVMMSSRYLVASGIYTDWAQVLGHLLVTRRTVFPCPQKVAFSVVRGVIWEIRGQLLDTQESLCSFTVER